MHTFRSLLFPLSLYLKSKTRFPEYWVVLLGSSNTILQERVAFLTWVLHIDYCVSCTLRNNCLLTPVTAQPNTRLLHQTHSLASNRRRYDICRIDVSSALACCDKLTVFLMIRLTLFYSIVK